MHPLLEQLDRETDSVLKELDARATQATPPNQTEKWSVQQIVEHLLLSYRATIPALQTRLQKRTATRAVPSLAQRLGQFGIVRLGRFPAGRNAPPLVAPALPATVQSGAELSARVHAELAQLDLLLAAGEKLFGTQRAASHMVLGPMSMAGWRKFHLVHGLHHLRQIARIRQANGI